MPSLIRGPPRSGVSFVGRLTMFLSPLSEPRWPVPPKKARERRGSRFPNFESPTGRELRLQSQAARSRGTLGKSDSKLYMQAQVLRDRRLRDLETAPAPLNPADDLAHQPHSFCGDEA